jgi:hypothetical protein
MIDLFKSRWIGYDITPKYDSCERRGAKESIEQSPMDSWSMLIYVVKASIIWLGRSLFLLRGMIQW